jgi:maltose O-acetyltransferase
MAKTICKEIGMRLIELLTFVVRRSWQRLGMYWFYPLFESYGQMFRYDPSGIYNFNNISVGDDVSLGTRCFIKSLKAKVKIGNKVMFGPDVVIIGGDHNTALMGRFLKDMEDTLPENDQNVTIEDDVWIGARAIILKGVVIGRGAVVGAGSVVTKSVPPYAMVAGVPAKVLRFRGDVEAILRHEELLYPLEHRLGREVLERQHRTPLTT